MPIITLVALLIGGAYVMHNSSLNRNPGTILNLEDWKLQLPVASRSNGQIDEVKRPDLSNYSSWFFGLGEAGEGVVFRAPVGGQRTPGAKFARTELRQMAADGTRPAAWSSADSTWSMTIREAVTHLPPVRQAIVVGQIHGIGSHYVALIRLDDHRLWVKTEAGSAGTLDDNYQLGAVFTVRLVASGDVIRVYYQDALKAELREECNGCYFKAGAYLQSNTQWDKPQAYGEVVIYGLEVRNSPAQH